MTAIVRRRLVTRKRLGRRPTPVPADCAARIQALASEGATLALIAHRLHIGKDLLRQWLDRDPELVAAVERGKALAEKQLFDRLWKSAMSGNVVAGIFLAKSRFGWRDQGDADQSNRPVVNIVIRAPSSPEDYRPPILIEQVADERGA